MILGLIFPTSGETAVLGEPIFGGTPGQRASAVRRVGALIEEPAFWNYLSGRRNLEYFARAAGPADDRERRLRRVDEVLRTVGLDQAANKKVKAYSQGMRQRLGIALALSSSPELLVLDEPTTGVDVEAQESLAELLDRLHRDLDVTVIYVSHEFGAVERYVDRLVLVRGGIVFDGPPRELPGIWHDPSHVHV
jgi:ABC-2 type transport system ATP-binding protein